MTLVHLIDVSPALANLWRDTLAHLERCNVPTLAEFNAKLDAIATKIDALAANDASDAATINAQAAEIAALRAQIAAGGLTADEEAQLYARIESLLPVPPADPAA